MEQDKSENEEEAEPSEKIESPEVFPPKPMVVQPNVRDPNNPNFTRRKQR